MKKLSWLAIVAVMMASSAFAQEQGGEKAKETTPATDVAPASSIPYDATDLHPAFKLDPDTFHAVVKKGQELGQKTKKPDKFYEQFRKDVYWQKGRKGKADAAAFVYDFYGDFYLIKAFEAGRKYETVEAHPAIKDGQSTYLKDLEISIVLRSYPKVGLTRAEEIANVFIEAGNDPDAKIQRHVLAEANPNEVEVVKFVLDDNKGNFYAASQSESTKRDGETTFRGVESVQSRETVSTNVSGSGSTFDRSGASTTFVNANARSTFRRVSLVPYSSDHPYFQSDYTVRFPLFDEKGKPLITKDHKKMTLRIITPNGEMSVDYDLSPRKK